jgi:hypothetical protein
MVGGYVRRERPALIFLKVTGRRRTIIGGMLDWLVHQIWAAISAVPALFVDEGTPTFTLVRTMFALLLIVLVVYLMAMRPFRSVIGRAIGAAQALLTRRRS